MQQFLETICIRDGVAQHIEWHQKRVDATLHHFSGGIQVDSISLVEILTSCPVPAEGFFRCRLLYDANAIAVEFFPHILRAPQTFQLVEAPSRFDYRYKYADRAMLDALYAQRGDADDILITRDGWITDTSLANIAFQKNGNWYSPSFPLLAGTTWKRLVFSGILIPRPIHRTHLEKYEAFKVFNAMNEWAEFESIAITKIWH